MYRMALGPCGIGAAAKPPPLRAVTARTTLGKAVSWGGSVRHDAAFSSDASYLPAFISHISETFSPTLNVSSLKPFGSW